MTPCPPARILARRRLGAIALLWASRLCASLLIAWPIADVFRGLGAGRGAERDAALFEPGALFLLEALRLGDKALLSALQTAAFSWCIFSLLLLVPVSALLVAMAHEGRLELGAWLGRALQHVPRFLLLAGLTVLAQALILLAFVLLYIPLHRLWLGRVSERASDLLSVAWFGLAAAGVSLFSVLHALARAANVRYGARVSDNLVHAIAVLRQWPGKLSASWGVVGVASLLLIAGAAYAVDAAHIERPDIWRIVVVAFVHQGAALGLAALRAAWLAVTLRLVSARPHAPTILDWERQSPRSSEPPPSGVAPR